MLFVKFRFALFCIRLKFLPLVEFNFDNFLYTCFAPIFLFLCEIKVKSEIIGITFLKIKLE